MKCLVAVWEKGRSCYGNPVAPEKGICRTDRVNRERERQGRTTQLARWADRVDGDPANKFRRLRRSARVKSHSSTEGRGMDETSASLLDRARHGSDSASWQRLVELYTPLIRGWLRRHAQLRAEDADDLVQEVLAVVVRKLPQFERQPRAGAFRRWLRTITVNILREFWRGQRVRPLATGGGDFQEMLDQLENPESGLSHLWDLEHDQHVTRKLLDMIRPRFEATTWQAFQRVALDGVSPDATAGELGITVNAVFIAKSRVLALLRQEGKGLID